MTMNPTIFDKSRPEVSGHHIFDADFSYDADELLYDQHISRKDALRLPGITENELARHYTNLSLENHGVDNDVYPLGSCTMKYNPKRNDQAAALSGFRDVHPLQPDHSMSGIWEMMYHLQAYFAEITGMDHVTLQPAAGAHGEMTGLLMIQRYLKDKGELTADGKGRNTIIIADSAHGTNPASASMTGFKCKIIPTTKEGLMDLELLKASLDDTIAGLMITNPSTIGLFETQIEEIAALLHANGSLLYYDGANLNALMGIIRPGDMGFDVVHINTHKTFSTPHGGGGPGAGPVGIKDFLSPYLPTPFIYKNDAGDYLPNYDHPSSIGRMKAFYGHISVLIRAYSYIRTLGAKGIRQTSENAVLNANYVQATLRDILPPVYDRLCMHECLLSGEQLNTSAYNLAKRLIDYDIHPPTLLGAGCVYFSEELKSAMLIEPTETESKQSLDHMITLFRHVIQEAEDAKDTVDNAPYNKRSAKIECAPAEVQLDDLQDVG